jgi:hypothetical protein
VELVSVFPNRNQCTLLRFLGHKGRSSVIIQNAPTHHHFCRSSRIDVRLYRSFTVVLEVPPGIRMVGLDHSM